MNVRAPLAAGLAGVALALGGCGGGTRPDPVKLPVLGYRPPTVTLPAGLPPGAIVVDNLYAIASVRPAQLQFASDGKLARLHWTSWGGSVARARGTATVHVCSPDCASGFNRSFPASITLRSPTACGTVRYYGSATVMLDMPSGRKPWGSYIQAPCAVTP